MANLYLSDELGEPAIGDIAVVTGPDARHAVTVSRLAVDERVTVGNGVGVIASGAVVAVAPGEFSFRVETIETVERATPAIWLTQALAKGDRDELAIQAATELGVDGVIPWSASRSISKWEGAKIAKGQQRWEAVVREATKQSARAWLPEVGPLTTTRQLAALASSARVIVLDPVSDTALTALSVSLQPATEAGPGATPGAGPEAGLDIILVVGPEGGISPGELDVLYAAGAIGARLGSGILRTSTAGPAAIAVLSAKLGRW